MSRLYLISAFFITFWPGVSQAAVPCFAPSGDWITGGDLAAALPALAALPANLKVSYAPVPGLERVFHPDELRRLALGNGLPDPKLTANVCSAWPLAPLTPEMLVGAMEKALSGRSPQVELMGRNLAPAPAGEIVFPLAGLSAYSENAVIWKGYVLYAGTRRFETWASVRVRVKETHLMAHGAIHSGDRLSPGQWRPETYAGPPLRDEILSDGASVEGLVARRDFADGAPLPAGFFETPKAVERGDTVSVLADVGAARIEAPGVALAAGRCGEVIAVRNPRSNRTFRARIASAGHVEVLPGASAGLVGTDMAGANPL